MSLIINKEDVLENVAGDLELLQEVIDIFLEDSPDQMSDIRDAISRGDAGALREAAHAFKGAVGNFGVENAYVLARELELMGQAARLDGAAAKLEQLEHEMETFEEFFSDPHWMDYF